MTDNSLQFIYQDDVLKRFKIGRTTLHNWQQRKLFLQPIKIAGSRKNAWFESEIIAIEKAIVRQANASELEALAQELHEARKHLI